MTCSLARLGAAPHRSSCFSLDAAAQYLRSTALAPELAAAAALCWAALSACTPCGRRGCWAGPQLARAWWCERRGGLPAASRNALVRLCCCLFFWQACPCCRMQGAQAWCTMAWLLLSRPRACLVVPVAWGPARRLPQRSRRLSRLRVQPEGVLLHQEVLLSTAGISPNAVTGSSTRRSSSIFSLKGCCFHQEGLVSTAGSA